MRACRRVAGTAPLVGCALISEARALLGILRAQLRLSALRSHLHELTLTGMHCHHSIMCDADEQAGSCSSASCCCARASSCCRCCCAGTPSLTTLSNFAVTSCCCCSAFASSSAGRGREGRLAIVVALNFPPGELSLLGRCKKHLQRF